MPTRYTLTRTLTFANRNKSICLIFSHRTQFIIHRSTRKFTMLKSGLIYLSTHCSTINVHLRHTHIHTSFLFDCALWAWMISKWTENDTINILVLQSQWESSPIFAHFHLTKSFIFYFDVCHVSPSSFLDNC